MTTPKCRPLVEILAEVEDFRKPKGKRHPLSAVLTLACVAMMCGYRSYSAMAEWGRNYGTNLAEALGFTHRKTPCASTWHTIFRHLSIQSHQEKLGQWASTVIGRII